MFDTLMYAKRLEAAGMTREQAEAQVNVIAEMVVDGVATKQDIALLKQDIALQKAEMGKEFAEMRTEFANVYSEFSKIRSEIHSESNKNLKIMGSMFIASTTITIGVLGLLLK
ncbi:coiled-coil domain-containing protein [Bdellovibrio sp. HCB-162]|uniref:coiled-coil domain-containing protein n=1 Tax=Bdellovibrio sp. HCB-162 TaxID=3394234 RepID=UPI0039BCA841